MAYRDYPTAARPLRTQADSLADTSPGQGKHILTRCAGAIAWSFLRTGARSYHGRPLLLLLLGSLIPDSLGCERFLYSLNSTRKCNFGDRLTG
jgi:hypothetical protein